VTTDYDDVVVTYTVITAPSGKFVVVPDVEQDERLTPTMVGYLDRRLGLDSKWPKLP
jgi:hypothetical protein